MANKAHHRDRVFVRAGRLVRATANTNPRAVCWVDGLTLAEHQPHRNGNAPKWQAGHTIDGVPGPAWLHVEKQPPVGEAWVAPEASTCNTSRGAVAGNRRRSTGYNWP